MPDEQKVPLMSLYLEGKAKKWLFIKFKSLSTVSWETFTEAAIKRFTEYGYHNVVAQLHELKQTGTIEEYHTIFEELRVQVLQKEPKLTETYFILSFIGGL